MPTDTVLEIGPGTGTLTTYLVRQSKHVVAVEFDHTLAQRLPRNITAPNLEVVEQDILSFNLNLLPAGYKVVANIPYYLTSHLIRVLSESANPPQTAVLLVQKELAQRVAAAPGQMSLLSVTAQFYWHVSLGQVIPKALFIPPPKVDSQILVLNRPTQPLWPGVDSKAFFRLVKAGFANRRKTVSNSLAAGLRLPKSAANELLGQAGLNPGSRPQELALQDWKKILDALMVDL